MFDALELCKIITHITLIAGFLLHSYKMKLCKIVCENDKCLLQILISNFDVADNKTDIKDKLIIGASNINN